MASIVQPTPRPRLGEWLEERLGLKGIVYPVPEHANALLYVLGGISFTGFIILFITAFTWSNSITPIRPTRIRAWFTSSPAHRWVTWYALSTSGQPRSSP